MTRLRHIDVRHLAALDAVVAEGTFARAAERLGYTQAAVSQQIAALESIIDAKLFDRPGGPMPARLTPVGELLAERSAELLARVDAIGEEVERVRDGTAGTLGIGTFQSVSAVVLPAVLSQIRQRFPDLSYRITNADDDETLFAALESGVADVSFVAAEGDGVAAEPILSDPWVVVAPAGRFAEGVLDVELLHDQPLIGQHLDVWQRQCAPELRAAGLEPNVVFRSNDNTTVHAMVRAGIGVAIIPWLAADDRDPALSIHLLTPRLSNRTILLARRCDRTVTPAVDAFADIAHQVCRELRRSVVDLDGPERAGGG